MTRRLSEPVLALRTKAWLEARGLEVYAEVVFRDGRIDLVGVDATRLVTVEVKVSFGIAVLEQAARWRDYATETWVAVPRHVAQGFGAEVCRTMNLGLFGVDAAEPWERRPWNAGEDVAPVWKHSVVIEPVPTVPHLAHKLRAALFPEQRDSIPGTNGGHATKFTRTAQRLAELVAAEPGITLKDAVGRIDHHYSTKAAAVSSLGGLLLRTGPHRPGAMASIRIEGRGSKATLWPQQEGDF